MSDSNSINPVGLSTAVVGGAAVGAAAPKVAAVAKKYAPAVKAGVDSVSLSTKNAATKVGSTIATVATRVGSKVKDLSTTAFKSVADYSEKGLAFAKKLVPAKLATVASAAIAGFAKFIKKPMVAIALVAGLAYGVVSKLGNKG